MTKRYFLDQALFPGSHCLNAPILPELTLKSDEFMRLSLMPADAFEQWVSLPLLSVSIPPHTGSAELPERAMITFENPRPLENGSFATQARVIFFRRGTMTALEEITPLLLKHFELDIPFVMETLEQLGADMPTLRDGLTDGFALLLIQFYDQVDPSLMEPVIRQRAYSLEGERYFGHVCSACATVNAQRQCPCRAGVYYCNSVCQKRHWKQHKLSCKTRRQADV